MLHSLAYMHAQTTTAINMTHFSMSTLFIYCTTFLPSVLKEDTLNVSSHSLTPPNIAPANLLTLLTNNVAWQMPGPTLQSTGDTHTMHVRPKWGCIKFMLRQSSMTTKLTRLSWPICFWTLCNIPVNQAAICPVNHSGPQIFKTQHHSTWQWHSWNTYEAMGHMADYAMPINGPYYIVASLWEGTDPGSFHH
jgi:hypothetical protein